MILGFTGTRNGMSDMCVMTVHEELERLTVDHVFVMAGQLGRTGQHGGRLTAQHGDCVGADADFDTLCRLLMIPTFRRPCTLNGEADHRFRAYTPGPHIGEPTNPMARNRELAKACDLMLACPPTREPVRSGTWATIGYARKYGKPVWLFFPDGEIAKERRSE